MVKDSRKNEKIRRITYFFLSRGCLKIIHFQIKVGLDIATKRFQGFGACYPNYYNESPSLIVSSWSMENGNGIIRRWKQCSQFLRLASSKIGRLIQLIFQHHNNLNFFTSRKIREIKYFVKLFWWLSIIFKIIFSFIVHRIIAYFMNFHLWISKICEILSCYFSLHSFMIPWKLRLFCQTFWVFVLFPLKCYKVRNFTKNSVIIGIKTPERSSLQNRWCFCSNPLFFH